MVTKIINHLVFEPAKVSIMANCGSGITIGSTHTTAPIGEGSLTVVVYTTLPNENILINFNYEDSSCSPTMTLTTAINPECIEVKIIEIECIEPEIPIISYDCDNGLVISNFDNNLTYNYLPGAFLTEGNYVLTVSNNGCIKEVPFTVQSCCFNYGVIANYSCSTKKLNITIYDTVTDSYIPGNPNWVVNADIADPAHCTSYVNPIPMTYFPSGSISMSSTGTLNLCDGSYSINIYLQVNNSCIIGTTVLVDCHCDININVTVDYTCNSKELIVNTTCTNCNVYIKKLNANGFLFGDVPDDGTVLPLFPLYGKYPKNDYYYSIPSVNTLLAVNSFINSNDLGQLGSLSNGYYLVVLANGDCYTIYKFRVSCNEIECNLIHYDEGDVKDTDIRVIDVTGITGNVYIDLMTGGYPDSIELYYSNNNTATLSSLTSDTILVRTPPIVDYKCVTPPNQVINGFWQNNIGTGVAGNPYIWNGVNTSLYSISDNVPVDFTIPGSTWIATYPHAGGNPFDNYYSIPLSVYTANISNIDSGNYNGVYITSTNAYLSNDHMFISSSGRLNFNLDGSKNYIKLRFRYNENSCKVYFHDGITPWISGFVYNFPFCNDCVYSGLTVGINIDNYNSTNGQITLSASSVGFNNLINPTYKWYIINSNEPLDDVGHAEFSSYTIDKYNTVGNTVYINQVGKICAGSSFIYESDFAVFVVATDDNGHTVYSYFKHSASCALDYIHYAALEPLLVNSGSFYNININDFDFYHDGTISGCTDNASGFIENLSINGGWSGSINNSDVNHIYSGNMGEVNGVIIFGSNPCNPNMLVRSSFHVGCIDCENITAPVMQLVQANCATFSDAYIEVTQGCGVGYQLQLSIDGGISWTDINVGYILPLTGVEGYTYSVIVRCVHLTNLSCYAMSDVIQYSVNNCDCEVCNPTYTIVSANPCNASNGSVTIDNFDLCDNTTFYLNGTPINLGINGWDNLSAGIYTLQYTSNDGCMSDEQIEILNTSSTISFDVNDITLLCGSENSLINILNISGGVSPYSIEIKDSIGAILESATGITTSNYTSTTLFNSGLYNITVKDSLSCVSSSLMNIIPCSTPLTFTHSVINSTCNGSYGSIRIDGLVGTNTVAIKLNGTNDVDGGCSCSFMTGWTTFITTATNYTFTNLAAGNYQVCIENSNECCYCKTITVNNDGYNCIASCGSSIGNVLSSSVGTKQLNGLCDRTICQGQNLSFYFALSGTNCNLTPTFKLDGNTISNTVLTGGYGVVLSGLSAGVHTLNVSYGICGDDIDYIITVVAKPIINTISNITVCNGGSVNIDITGTVGANYTYTHNNTSIIGIANSGSGTIDGSPDISFTAINNTTTPKVVTFTVTPIGVNCNGTPVTFNVTINPTPSIVLNDIIKCKGQLVSTISLPSTYTWTNNNTSIGLAASGTGSIPSFTTLNSGTAIITVTPIQLGCIGTPETFEIFVEDAPVTSPVNNIAVCHNSIIPEIDFVSTIDSFYTWTSSINLGVGYSGSGSFPSFTATNLGTTPLVSTITVYTNSELGCPGNTITFTITVYPKLADTTVHEIEICQNQMLNYDCSIDNCVSGTGSYSSPNLPVGFSLNSITGIVSGSTNLVSTISFTINFICNHGNGVECSTSNNYTITVSVCTPPCALNLIDFILPADQVWNNTGNFHTLAHSVSGDTEYVIKVTPVPPDPANTYTITINGDEGILPLKGTVANNLFIPSGTYIVSFDSLIINGVVQTCNETIEIQILAKSCSDNLDVQFNQIGVVDQNVPFEVFTNTDLIGTIKFVRFNMHFFNVSDDIKFLYNNTIISNSNGLMQYFDLIFGHQMVVPVIYNGTDKTLVLNVSGTPLLNTNFNINAICCNANDICVDVNLNCSASLCEIANGIEMSLFTINELCGKQIDLYIGNPFQFSSNLCSFAIPNYNQRVYQSKCLIQETNKTFICTNLTSTLLTRVNNGSNNIKYTFTDNNILSFIQPFLNNSNSFDTRILHFEFRSLQCGSDNPLKIHLYLYSETNDFSTSALLDFTNHTIDIPYSMNMYDKPCCEPTNSAWLLYTDENGDLQYQLDGMGERIPCCEPALVTYLTQQPTLNTSFTIQSVGLVKSLSTVFNKNVFEVIFGFDYSGLNNIPGVYDLCDGCSRFFKISYNIEVGDDINPDLTFQLTEYSDPGFTMQVATINSSAC